jgi:hypothetical protein
MDNLRRVLMKVIREGKIWTPTSKNRSTPTRYQCSRCKTVFEAYDYEFHFAHEIMPNDYRETECPVCHEFVSNRMLAEGISLSKIGCIGILIIGIIIVLLVIFN